MALQRPIAKTLSCQNCQRWILGSFMAAAGVQSFPKPARATFAQTRGISRSTVVYERTKREGFGAPVTEDHPFNDVNDEYPSMSTRARPLQPGEQDDQEIAREAEAELVEESEQEYSVEKDDPGMDTTTSLGGAESENKEPESQYIPWYLQGQSSVGQRPENPLTARQRIPDLPEHSPALLEPLLEQVSVELGMDDLSILDLRALDPPPALGANLFMIIGTARSEKHLHVSADRLCRWLRSTYKLRPYADGLLGRNELKLKMRRKAKRSKLLSAVGAKATADSEIDDGIRTGWVCVNVGRVEGGEWPKTDSDLERERNVVGFGTHTGGSNVVVQMMTEEKRGEVDLENLWTEILETARVKKQKIKFEEVVKGDTHDARVMNDRVEDDTSDPYLPSHSYIQAQDAGEQVRA